MMIHKEAAAAFTLCVVVIGGCSAVGSGKIDCDEGLEIARVEFKIKTGVSKIFIPDSIQYDTHSCGYVFYDKNNMKEEDYWNVTVDRYSRRVEIIHARDIEY